MTSDPVERFLLKTSGGGRKSRLRPMQLSESFDLALRIYRSLGWTILGGSAVPTLFTLGGFAFLFAYVVPGFGVTGEGTSQSRQVVEATINFGLGAFVALPLVLIGVSLASTFVAPLVADYMNGNVPNAKAAREAQWRFAPRMVLVSLRESLLASSGALVAGLIFLASWWLDANTAKSDTTAGVVLLLGSLALVGGGLVALYIISVHALVAPIAALEGLGAKAAAKRSKELMKGRPYHGSGYDIIWALYLFLGLIALALGSGAAALVALIGLEDWAGMFGIQAIRPFVETVLGLAPVFAVLWIIVPVWAVTVTIVYFERRVRLEGYDIEALAADVWRSDREGRFQL